MRKTNVGEHFCLHDVTEERLSLTERIYTILGSSKMRPRCMIFRIPIQLIASSSHRWNNRGSGKEHKLVPKSQYRSYLKGMHDWLQPNIFILSSRVFRRAAAGINRAVALNQVYYLRRTFKCMDVSIQAQIINDEGSAGQYGYTYCSYHDLSVVEYLSDTIGVCT